MADLFESGFALLVGVDENKLPEWALPGVKNDVSRLDEVLVHPARCAYPRDHVEVLLGPDSTRSNILDALDRLREKIEKHGAERATAFVYYSGHGNVETAGDRSDYFLIPYDLAASSVAARALRATDFADAVGALRPGRLLVVLDCCHAAGMGVKNVARFTDAPLPAKTFIPSGDSVSAREGEKALAVLAEGVGRAILSSSSGEESSYLRPDRRMSIFTYHLIEALTGHAQPMGGAAEVLVSDVVSYVHRKVPASARDAWNRSQTPDYQITGNFPVAKVLGGKGLGVGQQAPEPLDPLPRIQVTTQVGSAETVVTQTFSDTHIQGNVAGRDAYSGGRVGAAAPSPPTPAAPATGPHGEGSHGSAAKSPVVGGGLTSGEAAERTGPEERTAPRGPGLEEALEPVLEVLLQDSSERGPGSEFDALFSLSAELARGAQADVTRVETGVASILAAVPASERPLRALFSRPELAKLKPGSLEEREDAEPHGDG